MQVVETVINFLDSQRGDLANLLILGRLARVARVVRVVRVIRVMRLFRAMRLLLTMIFGTLRSVLQQYNESPFYSLICSQSPDG